MAPAIGSGARPIGFPYPALRDGRVVLRPWSQRDVDMLAAASADLAVRRNSSLRAEGMPGSAQRWLAKRETMRLAGTGISLAIEDAERPGVAVGCTGLNGLDAARRVAAPVCWLVPDARGRGLGRAATELVCRWAFNELGLAEVVGLIEPGNAASMAMLTAMGWRDDGPRPRSHRVEGALHDMWAFSWRPGERPTRRPCCTAVVLAAGRGTRMAGPVPKPLQLVAGRPMLQWVTEAASAATGRACVVVADGPGGAVADHARQAGGWVVAQGEPRGSAHALVRALEDTGLDRHSGDDMVLALNADAPLLRPGSLRRLIAACAAGAGIGAILAFGAEDGAGYGQLVFGPDGRVARLAAHDGRVGATLSATGAYCLVTSGLRERLARVPQADGEYPLGLVADGAAVGLDVVALVDDPLEGLGANTPAELERIRRIARARQPAPELGAEARR